MRWGHSSQCPPARAQHALWTVLGQPGKRRKDELKDVDFVERTIDDDSMCIIS